MSTSNATATCPDVKATLDPNRQSGPSFSLESSANPIGVAVTFGGQVYLGKSPSFVIGVPSRDTISRDPLGNSEGYFGQKPSNLHLRVRTVGSLRYRSAALSADMSPDYHNHVSTTGIHRRRTPAQGQSDEKEPTTSRRLNAEDKWFKTATFSVGWAAFVGILIMLFGIYALDRWVATGWIVDAVTISGALIVALAGIAWIAIAWLMIGITARRWWKTRS